VFLVQTSLGVSATSYERKYHLADGIWTFDLSCCSSVTWGNRFVSWVHMLRRSRDQTSLRVVSSMPSNEKWILFYTDTKDLKQCCPTILLLSATIMYSCAFVLFCTVMSVKCHVLIYYTDHSAQKKKCGNYRGISLLNACYELYSKLLYEKLKAQAEKFLL